jgi:hypothetical protein
MGKHLFDKLRFQTNLAQIKKFTKTKNDQNNCKEMGSMKTEIETVLISHTTVAAKTDTRILIRHKPLLSKALLVLLMQCLVLQPLLTYHAPAAAQGVDSGDGGEGCDPSCGACSDQPTPPPDECGSEENPCSDDPSPPDETDDTDPPEDNSGDDSDGSGSPGDGGDGGMAAVAVRVVEKVVVVRVVVAVVVMKKIITLKSQRLLYRCLTLGYCCTKQINNTCRLTIKLRARHLYL